MLEIARNFEQMGMRFDSIVAVGLGVVTVIAGLFVWLGGLGFRRLLLAVVGAASGGICGYFITGRDIISAMVLAAVGAIIATIFEKMFFTILAAGLAALLGLAVLLSRYIESSNTLEQACSQLPAYGWIVIAVLVVVFIAAGFLLWRLTSALCCAALGTILIFAGMILLLSRKGASPVGHISHSQLFYLGVFVVMTTFGTIEQLLLCERINKKLTRKKRAGKDKEKPEEESQSWRNR